MSENQYTILCVDDEQNILHSLKRLLRKEGYQLLLAGSGPEAFELLEHNEVHLVISDQRMPDMSGTEFLASVKDKFPDVLRIILTGYTDVDSITESINKGHIYKFFLKPWNDQNLKLEIRQALEQYDLIKANRKLDKKVVKQNRELQQINDKLEDLVEERTREIALKSHALELSHAILDDLPISVMGIDGDGVIVLANKMAQSMVGDGAVNIGIPLSKYFSTDVMASVAGVIDSGRQASIDVRTVGDSRYQAVLMPLSGAYHGTGVIMTLSETT